MTTDPHQRSRTRTPWQGRQRRILLIAGVVLLCPFVVFFTAKYYSDRNYAARLAAIRAEGAPVTVQDMVALQEYLENVVRTRDGWDDLYRAIRDVI